jgi:hypothetical protein
MGRLEPHALLALWERGMSRHPLDRSALLCAYARPEVPVQAIADLPLGEVTAGVLRLRAEWFSDPIRGHVDCASCGVRLQLSVSVFALLPPLDARLPESVEAAGGLYRLPTLRDLAAVASEHDVSDAARRLLARCNLDVARTNAVALSETKVAEVEHALEEADPYADLVFDVHCEECGRAGSVQLDAVALLWDEIDAHARELLGAIHRLAQAYGWTESEILALNADRRASYLAMVEP